jgi:outer membrane protein TolC
MLGFEHNPAIVAVDYAEKSAHRERQAAIGLFMPRISLKGAYTHLNKDIKIDFNPMLSSLSPILGEGLTALGLDLSYPLQRRNTAFLGGDVELPLFAGGKIWIANKAAKIEEERAHQQTRQVRCALMEEIVERYFGVELARQGVVIREEAVGVVEQHLHDVVLLEREGMAVVSERLYVEYRLAEVERDLQRARLQLETAQRALQNSLGVDRSVSPSTPMFLLSQIEPLEYFISMAELNNPQLGEVSRLRELARMNVRLQRANLFPEVVAMGGMVFCEHQLSPLVPRMAVGLGLNFKIFDGLNREYKLSAARLQSRRAEALEQRAEQDIELLIESLYNGVQSVIATVSSVERSERFATEFLRAKCNAFSEGVATATDVVDAALSLSRARLERVQTAYEFDVALARLLCASGMAEAFLRYLNAPTSQSLF